MPIADKKTRAAASKAIDELGTVAAAARLGTSRESLARIVAGLSVRAGTLASVERELQKGEAP